MKIHILGTGCAKCKTLYAQTEKALTQAGVQAEMEKVENIQDIMKMGVPMTPALLINGEVKSAGKIPETAQIVTWVMTAADKE